MILSQGNQNGYEVAESAAFGMVTTSRVADLATSEGENRAKFMSVVTLGEVAAPGAAAANAAAGKHGMGSSLSAGKRMDDFHL